VPTEAPSTEEQPADTTTDTDTATNALQTTINVTALAEIYVTITVDGTVAYDGYLESGQSTGPIAGSLFQVQTSSGANTSFTNACGTTFNMGYEEGDAYYELAATPDSCAA
jgi:methionine synthase I (cobalamin-dependent)